MQCVAAVVISFVCGAAAAFGTLALAAKTNVTFAYEESDGTRVKYRLTSTEAATYASLQTNTERQAMMNTLKTKAT